MPASWPSIRNKPPIIQREFKGANRLDPFSISPEYAYETLNLSSINYPIATTRPGHSLIGSFGTRVLGMGVWKDTELHVVFNDGTWRRLNVDGTWTQLASGLNTTAEWVFTNFKGNLSDICLIGANGVDSPRYYNGTNVSVLTGVPAGGKYITQFADRLWCAVGNELWASAYRVANDWALPTDPDDEDASAWYTTIETPNGETINGIVSGLTRLTITKPSSTHSLIGYAPSDYDVRVNTLGTGQFNQKSAVTLDGWLYQLDDAGFYRFPGSGQPVNDFSERIKAYFDLMSTADKAAAVLTTDNTRIYLGLGSMLIEYDPKRNTFYPWFGINALQFAQVGNKLYIGDTLGRVLLLGGSTSDAGQPIAWKLVPPTFTGQSMSQGILWKRLWATVDLSSGSTIGVSLNGNATGESWVQSGSTITGSGGIQRNAYYFPSNILPPTQQLRVKFEGTGPMQLHEWARDEDYYPLR
jgi:hypothetical protein